MLLLLFLAACSNCRYSLLVAYFAFTARLPPPSPPCASFHRLYRYTPKSPPPLPIPRITCLLQLPLSGTGGLLCLPVCPHRPLFREASNACPHPPAPTPPPPAPTSGCIFAACSDHALTEAKAGMVFLGPLAKQLFPSAPPFPCPPKPRLCDTHCCPLENRSDSWDTSNIHREENLPSRQILPSAMLKELPKRTAHTTRHAPPTSRKN